MATTNVKAHIEYGETHEGAQAAPASGAFSITSADQLLRQVATALLWEPTFYETGEDIADGIRKSALACDVATIARIAIAAREELRLRHVPLFLAVHMARRRGPMDGTPRSVVANTIARIVRRPDEIGELISLYWREAGIERKQGIAGKSGARLPWQMRRGLARAFRKFSPYQLAKWDEDDQAVSLKDALFLVHAAPQPNPCSCKTTSERCAWGRLIDGTLEAPDTWEVALSAGKDKKETWERLLREHKIGDMAVLMNLRNMQKVDVTTALIKERLRSWNPDSVALPFRFIAAAKAAPDFEDDLGVAMGAALSKAARLPGRTLYVVDVSGSMQAMLSAKSTMDRIDAAAGLAMLLREVSEDVTIYATAGNDHTHIHATEKVAPRHLFALRDAIRQTMIGLGGGGIFAFQSLSYIEEHEREPFDRVIVLTDEQDCDTNPARTLAKSPRLAPNLYLLNVAPYSPGLVTDGGWTRINGWSQRVVDYILFAETGRVLSTEDNE